MASTKAGTALFITLVAVASALPQNGTIFECTSEGRFPDPFDCTSFFTCVAEIGGSLVRTKGDCKGYAFHPELRTCVNPSKVPGCTSRKPKQLVRQETVSVECTESAFICSDCKTVVNCIGTEAYEDSTCGKGYSCSAQGTGRLAGAAACLPIERAEEGCKCTTEDLNKPKVDPNTETGFIFCPPDGGDATVHNCPQGLVYDVEERLCLSPDGSPICSKQGTYTLDDCTGTYSCLQTTSGFVKSTMTCEEDLLFSPIDKICNDPCNWPEQKHECIAEGRFKNPTDCSQFVVCVETAPDSGEFTETIRNCPGNYLWDDSAAEGAGHCVSADSVECDAVPKHTCPIEGISCPSGAFRSDSFEEVDDTENTIQNVIQLLQEEQQ